LNSKEPLPLPPLLAPKILVRDKAGIAQDETEIPPGFETRIERAEIRTVQAEARTAQAKTRTEQAEARTEHAEVRTEQAESRTEQAKTRTEQAEIRTEAAETRSEQAIRVSELNYRRLFEAARDGILIMEADTGRISDVNPALLEILGFSHAELAGTPIWELGTFRDVVANKAKFEQLHQQGYILYENLPLETKAGRRIIVEFVGNVYQVGDRNVIQCNVRDITDRKKSEEQLLWKTAFFEAQVHSSPDGILVVDSTGKKIVQNQRMIDLWNIPPEFAAETDDTRQLEWVANQTKNPRQSSEKVAYLQAHPDEISQDEVELIGGKFFDRYSAPVRGQDGKYYGRIWVFRDITERRRSDARFRRLVDSNAQGVLFWSAKGEVTGANDAFLRLINYTREDLENGCINWMARTPPEYADLDRRALEELAVDGTCAPFEKEFIRKDGSRVHILIGSATFEDNPEEGLSFVLDLTERKKLEKQFLRAQRMESIGTLAGGIAHDLNNILSPIMMSIGVLRSTATDPEAKRLLDTIEVSSRRGADIVRQVLSFARGIEGERVEVQPQYLLKDLEKIIKDTFPKNIQLQFSVTAETRTILGDPTQVQQILLNLCVNARDAMPDGGNLSITMEDCVLDEQYVAKNIQARAGRFVKISVTDSGMGIPPDLQDKIFEPFFTTKELNHGTGLGLSTVMAIVKSHKGIINLYSEPGKGTTFRVYLPAMESCSEAWKDVPEQVSLPRGNGETILVVDDEASILSVTSQTLQAFGYHVLPAADGAEAVALYAQHRREIAVVLTDIMMPVMDGAAVVRVLQRINPAVKIIATSGLSTHGSAVRAPGFNVRHFLTKPYMAGTLLTTLRDVLSEA
jgi:PAS domain S-box-containing protein